MKQKLLSILAAFASLTAAASGQWTMNGRTFDVDTIYHATVGPGTTQTTIHFTGPTTLHVYYATVDLTNEIIDIRSACGSDQTPGCENISSVAKRKSTDNLHYFAAINADFFQTKGRVGEPVSNSIVDGEIFRFVNNGRTHFTAAKGWVDVANTTFSMQITDGTTSKKVSGINKALGTNDLAIYSRRYADKTTTGAGVCEVTIKPEGGVLKCGETKFTVTSSPVSTGASAIPDGECVLAGSSSYADFVSNLKPGDELTFTANLVSGDKNLNDAFTQAGGLPVILNNGVICGSEVDTNLLQALHPRTAIGYNEDKTKLVMLVVDGRGQSAGVNSDDLAALMQRAGCNQAMNLDGGGSSSIYIDKIGTRNKPSDGKERAVGNGLYAVASCPTDNTPVTIEFMTKVISLPRYSYYTPVVYAYNKYGMLIDTDFKGYTLSCDADFATVSEDGLSILCSGTGYRALTATYGDYSTTIPVEISDAQPRFRLTSALVDPFNDYKAELVSTIEGKDSPVDNSVMTWSSEDATIATVDELGNIHGLKDGETTIHAVLGEFDLTLPVKVEVPTTRYKSLFGDAELTLAKSALKSGATITKTANGFDLDFSISSNRGTYAGAKTNVNTFALPDSIRMTINPGTAIITKVVFSYVNYEGRTVYVTFTPEFTENTTVDLLFPISEIIDIQSRENFPINFTGINFYLNNAASTTHKISVTALDQVYTAISGEGGVEPIISDGKKFVITPNPVEKGATVTLTGAADDVEYTVFNMAGAKISEGKGNTLTAPAATGVYIIKAGKESQKLIVK